jgi:hypothetical protein
VPRFACLSRSSSTLGLSFPFCRLFALGVGLVTLSTSIAAGRSSFAQFEHQDNSHLVR